MPSPDFARPGPHSDPYDRAPIRSRRHDDDDDDDDDEISRFEPGLWGMQFTFGGLAPMSIGGLREFAINRLAFTELGFRRVLSNDWALLFGVGAGLFRHNPDSGDTQNDVGLAASYGFQKWFRVWRRIAPYAGGRIRIGYAEPEGRANWNVALGLGPMLGVEYFVGHRVSLSLQGDAQLRFGIFHGLLQTELATGIDAGGQMGTDRLLAIETDALQIQLQSGKRQLHRPGVRGVLEPHGAVDHARLGHSPGPRRPTGAGGGLCLGLASRDGGFQPRLEHPALVRSPCHGQAGLPDLQALELQRAPVQVDRRRRHGDALHLCQLLRRCGAGANQRQAVQRQRWHGDLQPAFPPAQLHAGIELAVQLRLDELSQVRRGQAQRRFGHRQRERGLPVRGTAVEGQARCRGAIACRRSAGTILRAVRQ